MAYEDSKGLVSINSRREQAAHATGESSAESSAGVSRRSFLKILGATSAVGVAGCAEDQKQTILPFVKGEVEQIPGVAVWYRSTCTECSAGCGIMVRTREGRAVKIEGSPDSPINSGGLCALGQSALQNLYDPDRVRQPIARSRDADRSGRAIYKYDPLSSWDDGLQKVADAIKGTDKKKALVTGELSGAQAELVKAFCAALKVEHVTWDPLQPAALAKASELVYGVYGVPSYRFDRAEVVVNFGADFLETWVSPVGFARDWAKSRKGAKPTRVVHIEPRLSLSGSNADLWLSAKAGTELKIALAILKSLLQAGRGAALPAGVRDWATNLTKDISLDGVVYETGVAKEKIALVTQYLLDAKHSLVIAGGAVAATAEPLQLQIIAALLNVMRGNVRSSADDAVDISAMRTPQSSASEMQKLIQGMQAGEYGVLLVHGANPAFTLPGSFGFEQARNMVPFTASLSSQLDETASLCDLVLPSHTALESWGDVRPMAGVYSLLQPVMRPVFNTRAFGDILLAVADKAGKSEIGDGAKSFEDFLKASWKKLYSSLSGAGESFDKFWIESVERGGYFASSSERAKNGSVRASIQDAVTKVSFSAPHLSEAKSDGKSLVLFPYYSVRTFDGRAANRPWLQEMPDPVTTAVWDSWAEIHPDTAKKVGLKKDDLVTVRNQYGEVNVGVYLTPYVQKGVVAIPVGQGHTAYGRYARENTSNGNVFSLLPATASEGGLALLSTEVSVSRGRGKAHLLVLQGSDTQGKAEIGRSEMVSLGKEAKLGHDDHHDDHHGHGDGHGEHHGPIKQMYNQREHPIYRWGMAVDLNSCTGCGACVVACSAENNIAFVGKKQVYKGREMSWLRIERYFDGGAEELSVNFVPVMCQHCGNAPCEPVCPVYATYHNEEGLNSMIYNRCVGTRYCSNNCSYKVRRFNWYEYQAPEPLNWQFNPDVTKRGLGVMEKCTFCVQRIVEAKDRAKDLGRLVEDGEVSPACVQSCPTKALTFGNLNDPKSAVSQRAAEERGYKILDKYLNTQPAVTYLKRKRIEA